MQKICLPGVLKLSAVGKRYMEVENKNRDLKNIPKVNTNNISIKL